MGGRGLLRIAGSEIQARKAAGESVEDNDIFVASKAPSLSEDPSVKWKMLGKVGSEKRKWNLTLSLTAQQHPVYYVRIIEKSLSNKRLC